MFCQNCGSEVSADAVFCGKCGCKLVVFEEVPVSSEGNNDFTTEVDNKTKNKRLRDVFEEEQFDDAPEADAYLKRAAKKLMMCRIAIVIGLCATLFLGGSKVDIFNPLRNLDANYAVGFICMVTAYILGGGIKRAFRIVGVILSVVLYFPSPFLATDLIKLCILAMVGVLCIFSIVYFPAVFVLIEYISLRINYKRAKEYLC